MTEAYQADVMYSPEDYKKLSNGEKVKMHNERKIIISAGDRPAAIQYLSERAKEPLAAGEKVCACMDDDCKLGNGTNTLRVPGSGIHNFAIGQVDFESIVTLAKDLDVFSSHEGCGAAGLVHKALVADYEIRQENAELPVGSEMKPEAGVLAQFEKIFSQDEISRLVQTPADELGIEFSKKVVAEAAKTGSKVTYRHLQVDRLKDNEGNGMHSAAIAVVDMASLFTGSDRDGAYVIHSLAEKAGLSQEEVVKELSVYGPLAEVIAHSHSHVGKDEMFTILIVTDDAHAEVAQKVLDAIKPKDHMQVMVVHQNEIVR